MDIEPKQNGPLVSILIPTYNRPEFLTVAIQSALAQDYRNIEVVVARDGGQPIHEIVHSFDDDRIRFIDRGQNRGIPFTLNQAIDHARGKYITYLGNDDLLYPNHVGTLVDALESGTDCRVAYSDLYRTYCRLGPDNSRQVLSKVLEVSRDFDRFVMLYFNHVLHVSVMHQRDLVDQTGPYNEQLNVLIDWDLLRRAVFFTDFVHVPVITGEYYSPIGESDRVSVQKRKDKNDYLRNVLTIRNSRPPKPWPKIKDLAIVLLTAGLDRRTPETIKSIWGHTFYPYQLYLPLPGEQLERIDSQMPNLILLPTDSANPGDCLETALSHIDAEYIAVVPAGFPIDDFWVEDCMYAILNDTTPNQALELDGSTPQYEALLMRQTDLAEALPNFTGSLRNTLISTGVSIRKLTPQEIPFQYDQLLCEAKTKLEINPVEAAEIYDYIARNYQNELYIRQFEAKAHLQAGNLAAAEQSAGRLNCIRPVVDTLLLQAVAHKKTGNLQAAVALLEQGKHILEGTHLPWN